MTTLTLPHQVLPATADHRSSSRETDYAVIPCTSETFHFQKPFGSFPLPSRRSPCRSRSRRSSSATPEPIGTRRAIGIRRSVTKISSPLFTRRRFQGTVLDHGG